MDPQDEIRVPPPGDLAFVYMAQENPSGDEGEQPDLIGVFTSLALAKSGCQMSPRWKGVVFWSDTQAPEWRGSEFDDGRGLWTAHGGHYEINRVRLNKVTLWQEKAWQ